MDVSLRAATLPLLDEYYRGFEMDPDIFADMSRFRAYVYAPEKVEAHYDRLKAAADRVDFLVMLGEKPIGEAALKHIDREKGTCELSIHLQNDSVKGRGYGTRAERLAVEYAFGTLGMEAVLASVVRKNARSQHVLEKLGFERTGQDEIFVYYRLNREIRKSQTHSEECDGNDS